MDNVLTPPVAAIAPRDPVTGEISEAGKITPALFWSSFDPKNYIEILIFIQTTFGLTHPQMMDLRVRVEKTFHRQPQVFSKRAPAPVTLNGVAITYGMLVGFGGYRDALKASADRVVKVARGCDPYGDAPRDVQIAMHKRAAVNRRAGWR